MADSDRAAFLLAIAENPDDDLPRLVYADWLEEHGEPERAEFIRVQCELARLATADSRRREIESRERELISAYGDFWRAGLPNRSVATNVRGEYRRISAIAYGPFERGFVAAIRVDRFSMFEAVADQVFLASPVHRLTAHDLRKPAILRLLRLSAIAHLVELDLSVGHLGNTGVDALIRSPQMARLRTLRLESATIGDSGAQAIADSARSRRLEKLFLAGNRIGDTGAEALAASPHLVNLTVLDLSRNDLTGAVRRHIRARFGAAVKL